MIYKIEISAHAESDLRDIYEYIAFKLFSPKAAAAQLVRLKAGIMSLDQMPSGLELIKKNRGIVRVYALCLLINFWFFIYRPNRIKKFILSV